MAISDRTKKRGGTMNEDEVYETLPDDPGLAFVKLEKLYLHKFDEATRDLQESSVYEFHEMTYLNEVVAAAKSLDIPGIQDCELPQSSKQLYDFARMVRRDVESLVVQIRISNSQSINRYSVALNATEKAKARHYTAHYRLSDKSKKPAVQLRSGGFYV
jgi:hypothetical protein